MSHDEDSSANNSSGGSSSSKFKDSKKKDKKSKSVEKPRSIAGKRDSISGQGFMTRFSRGRIATGEAIGSIVPSPSTPETASTFDVPSETDSDMLSSSTIMVTPRDASLPSFIELDEKDPIESKEQVDVSSPDAMAVATTTTTTTTSAAPTKTIGVSDPNKKRKKRENRSAGSLVKEDSRRHKSHLNDKEEEEDSEEEKINEEDDVLAQVLKLVIEQNNHMLTELDVIKTLIKEVVVPLGKSCEGIAGNVDRILSRPSNSTASSSSSSLSGIVKRIETNEGGGGGRNEKDEEMLDMIMSFLETSKTSQDLNEIISQKDALILEYQRKIMEDSTELERAKKESREKKRRVVERQRVMILESARNMTSLQNQRWKTRHPEQQHRVGEESFTEAASRDDRDEDNDTRTRRERL